jgi:hypothetical protein
MGREAARLTATYDGSLALLNQKHDAFAQLVATGLPASRAYGAAGYKGKANTTARACSSALLSQHTVSKRAAYLRPINGAKVESAIQGMVASITDRVERIRGYGIRRQAMLELMKARANDMANAGCRGHGNKHF